MFPDMHKKSLFLIGLLAASPAAAQIYKYVADDGSVVYTNQKPHPDAEPIDLPGLSVVDSPSPAAAGTTRRQETDRSPANPYRNFAFASPRPGETFQGTGNVLPVRLILSRPLRTSDRIVVYMDDVEQAETTNPAVDLQEIPRGTHEVRAEIVNNNGAVLTSAGPVTFHMKQHSRLHSNQPLVQPQVQPQTRPGGGSN